MIKLTKYKLKDLYEMGSGISSKPEQAGHGAPFVSFSTIFNNYYLPENLPDLMNTSSKEQETYSVKKGDIFITRTSETLDELAMSSVALKDYPHATFSGFAKRLRPTQEDITYDKFMAFYMRSKYFRKVIDSNAIMTLRASFNEEIFSYIDLLLPDYEEQKTIGDFLYTINSKIELNKKIIAELEAMGRSIYYYWFVQFDFPDANGRPYRSSGGKMVWNEEVSREIPEGWKIENLKENSLVQLIKPGISNFEGVKIYLATADVINNEINFGADKITFKNRESRANMQPVTNSIWFARMKNSKKSLYVGEYSSYFIKNFIFSTGFAGLKCKENFYLEYILNFINNDHFETTKDRLANGATQEAINNDSMAIIPLIIPKENILREYHKKTVEIYKKIYLSQVENRKLSKLRDWLLPMLMNGQVRVNK